MESKPRPIQSGKNEAKSNEEIILDAIPKDLLFGLLDNPYESLILVDSDGIIRFMSRENEPYYDVKVEDAIGKQILKINSNSELVDVIKSGRAKIGRSAIFKNQNRIVSRIPLRKGDKIIGAVGKLNLLDPEKTTELYERIQILQKRISYYTQELYQVKGKRYTFDDIIGESKAIRQAKAIARRAAQSDSTIIITGESGTGKELFAQGIHQASLRQEHSFISINCSAIPAELIESELFGYEPGAFTGSNHKGQIGKFELADKGTIFLDEIGDMPLNLQVKILRVLQEGEVEKIGSRQPKRVDFRVICATNRNLGEMVQKGQFRLDLYYRINVVSIELPPLQHMKEDIPLLVEHELRNNNCGLQKDQLTLSNEALAILKKHNWPGNVRELKNVIERSLIYCQNQTIMPEDLPPDLQKLSIPRKYADSSVPTLKNVVEKEEKEIIAKALEISGNNKRSAAEILGINRGCLYNKLRKYGLG